MVTLYKSEAELFSDIRFVEFGDLYEVEVPEEGDLVELELSPRDMQLLDLIKEGNRHFDSIGVHSGQPAYAVILGVSKHGNRYKQKIKIT